MKPLVNLALILLLAFGNLGARAEPPERFSYRGPCDASAAAALDADHFVVGNDEDAVLRVYRRGRADPLGPGLDLAGFLGVSPGAEVDIEAAALVGRRIYWISSHARNGKGRKEDSRRRFFATDIVDGTNAQAPQLRPVGAAYSGLLQAIEKAPTLRPYKLQQAARRAAEAQDGFNIEGLTATPDGRLLIGLRNPLPKQRALLVPLLNPAAVVAGEAPAELGEASEIDLAGRGVRSIELTGSSYLIVAGPPGDDGSFMLFRWSARAGDAPQRVAGVDLQDLRPEALFAIPGGAHVQLLSDDGGVRTESGKECKKLPPSQQTFRSLTLPLLPDAR
ncbi:MAG: hypothetical protein AW12_00062 [Candidatus Accumulibacter sp. BA-94]|uniref:DUF3616 domain-containing protein n=1 Tax=Accumulibacter sp. TaxID=2053492 RepID=UPI000452DC71|nr:DUF3616 domain-containing protein [Accumulibacter sp.]EXI93100.1 MAG: hypothetical protein AW12_00062 [Candidatus Accumulibacter sp. BA-94]HRD87585.1 DUF3616 domain-containing protein [Accumulibacter sp.]